MPEPRKLAADIPIRPSLRELFISFMVVSVSGFGGALPWARRMIVEQKRWMTAEEFNESFALAQLSPGPNVIIVTLIGYHVAGFAGAGVATVAMCGPTCLLAFFAARTWERFKEAPWRVAVQAGLVPVSLGPIAASAFVLARVADKTIYAGAVTVLTVAMATFTRINPLWLFAAGGALGLSGWL